MYNSSDSLKVRIVLPGFVLLETEAQQVDIPGTDGDFGILPGHVNLVSNARVGLISVINEKHKNEYFIYKGIVQVRHSFVNIVTDFAIDMSKETKTTIMDKVAVLKDELSDLDEGTVEARILADKLGKYQELSKFVM